MFRTTGLMRLGIVLFPKTATEINVVFNKFRAMTKSNLSDPQIIKILASHESGKSVSDICREHGISQGRFYKWKSKYSGMEVSQVKQLKDLEKELAQYKKIVEELTLQNVVLKM